MKEREKLQIQKWSFQYKPTQLKVVTSLVFILELKVVTTNLRLVESLIQLT